MLPQHKDPGRFNPALRNREIVLDPVRIQALIKRQAPRDKTAAFLSSTMDTLRGHVRAAGTALDTGNHAASGDAVAHLTALAVKIGARQLERDGRLIQASLHAGRTERARRLWHRFHGDLAALDEALGQLRAAPEHDGQRSNARSMQQQPDLAAESGGAGTYDPQESQ
ncbi:hypothetical protein [Arthrobacter sp. efr-133-R2A-63]|uniref:hypothetical protein n=1 Tax=Arthrobacter sp. efr-133-R2A-63 TaxID=3040278 RepID=UPI00254D1014|nr:hypothetical protein [Arthrobacter sp. efr-133-R2A-63]